MIHERFPRLVGLAARSTGFALAACAALAFSPSAQAGDQTPGSLLVFCEYSTVPGAVSLLTVTNTNPTENVRIEWVYYEDEFCQEFNRSDLLTAGDTLTVVANFHNPIMGQGFVYVVAKSEASNIPIGFDWLIGTSTLLDGLETFDYGVDPVSFQSPVEEGSATDLDADELRDLDGVEYAQSPDLLLVPRFLGQDPANLLTSELVLLNLTGGAQFTATFNVLLYNDNEEAFSAQHSFRCWTKVPLFAVSHAFSQVFLKNATNHDPAEVVGAPQLEAGWFQIDGSVAMSSAATVPDPALLGFLVEHSYFGSGADLPFASGLQANGSLLNRSVFPRLGPRPRDEPSAQSLPLTQRP